jgi:hypothetical protein
MKTRSIFVIIAVIGILYWFLRPSVEDLLLKRSGDCINAVITNDFTRVKYHKADYLYQFKIDGQVYTGNSLVTDARLIGESICVVYLRASPKVNRPVSYFKSIDKCDCNK